MQSTITNRQANTNEAVWLYASDEPSESSSDHELMSRYCEGDFSAFEILYHRYNRMLYRYIAWQTHHKDWVDEIVQDTWLRLHDARPNYRAQAGFKTFLYRIARNRMIDLIRQNRIVLASELGGDEDNESVFEHLVDQHAHAELVSENNMHEDALHEAINSLPHEQREALIAQQFSGLSLQEIAALTNTSVETVKSRLRYAMKKLRQILIIESGALAA